jgi:hypothetical protein
MSPVSPEMQSALAAEPPQTTTAAADASNTRVNEIALNMKSPTVARR